MTTTEHGSLLLESAYRLEKESADTVYMVQPMGGGEVDEFTWARTMDEARRMAAHLRSLNLPPNSQIAILSKNCAHFILTDLAIWMAGHVSVALYPNLNEETVRYILEHSEAKLLFVGKLDTWNEMKPGVPEGLPCISYPLSPPEDFPTWNDLIERHDPIDDSPTRPADDLAIIVYTSGSTGLPKGVMLSFGAMSTAGHAIGDVLNITPDDRIVSYLPLAHVMERWVVETGSLLKGFQVYFTESLHTFLDDMRRANPTLFQSIPRLWLKFQLGVFSKTSPAKLDFLLRVPIVSSIMRKKILTGLGLQAVRFAGSGSAPIPGELIAWYRRLGLELIEAYGMSENFCYSHVSRPGRARVGYVGNPYPGVEQRLSDEGEILVKSPGNMMGYFKEPELTKEAFTEDGFLKTGDRGEIDEDGRLRITGRTKELFKTSKGKYIAPVPIENLLNVDNHIELTCVSGAGKPQPFALVQLSEELRRRASADGVREEVGKALESLLKRVNDVVEHHERLKLLVVVKDAWTVEDGALTPTMKIKRGALEQRYAPSVDGWYEANQPVVWET